MLKNIDKFSKIENKDLLISIIFECKINQILEMFEVNIGNVWSAISVFCYTSNVGDGKNLLEYFGIDFIECDWKDQDALDTFKEKNENKTIYQFNTQNDTYNLFTTDDNRLLELLDVLNIEFDYFEE